MSKFKQFFYPVTTLMGTIIGAGLFSLPYIASRVGTSLMLVYFLIIGALALVVHLLFAYVVIRTPDQKRFTGFARTYLGPWGEKTAAISLILGVYGSLLVYVILGGEFLKNMLEPIIGGSAFFYTLVFFLIGALFIYRGLKAIGRFEFWAVIVFSAILLFILIRSLFSVKLVNLSVPANFKLFFLPYGPLLFSLWGTSIIPELEAMLVDQKQLLKKVVVLGVILSLIISILFTFFVLGVSGSSTSESAFLGLGQALGQNILYLSAIFGFLVIITSFIASGLVLRSIFEYDLKLKKGLAWALTCFVPLLLFILGFQSFIRVVSFVGGIFLGIDGILILLMYQSIKTAKYRLLTYPLMLIFILGIIYEIIYFIK